MVRVLDMFGPDFPLQKKANNSGVIILKTAMNLLGEMTDQLDVEYRVPNMETLSVRSVFDYNKNNWTWLNN